MSCQGIRNLVAAAVVTGLTACASESPTAPETDLQAHQLSLVTATSFVDPNPPMPFGKFNGVDFVRHTGRFVGTTSLGDFRVPYEIVAPAEAGRGNGTVLMEPPHFVEGPAARDKFFGRDFLFGRGFSYASVGWATLGNNILDPTATDVFIAGGAGGFDDEVVVQFTMALTSDALASVFLHGAERIYGYGVSQTSVLMHRILRSPAGQNLLDFTMLNTTWWQTAGFSGVFAPVTGVGKVVIVQSEGDLVLADAEVLRVAEAQSSDYRVYEVAGSAHIPDVPGLADSPIGPLLRGTNPVDWPAVARAMFDAGDDWVRSGTAPPTSVFVDVDAGGGPDPVYGFPTGIARNADLNAVGGVRLPDVELGRAQYIASDFGAPIAGLLGATVDLVCTPTTDGEVRFPNHGSYVSAFSQLTNALVGGRFLVQDDAAAMKAAAAQSTVGSPGACGT